MGKALRVERRAFAEALKQMRSWNRGKHAWVEGDMREVTEMWTGARSPRPEVLEATGRSSDFIIEPGCDLLQILFIHLIHFC